MTFFVYSTILVSITSFSLGCFVFFRNIKAKLNSIFFLMTIAIALWSFGLAMMASSPNAKIAAIWLNPHYLGCIFIPPTFLHVVLYIFKSTEAKKNILRASYIFAFLVLFLFIAGSLTKEPVQKFDYDFYTVSGHAYFVFVIEFFSIILYTIMLIANRIRHTEGLERTRSLYILIASLFAVIGGSSAFFPVYNIYHKAFLYFNALIIFYPIVVTYAIIRHQLLEIEVIIKKTLVFAGLFGLMFGVFAAVVALISLFVLPVGRTNLYLSTAISIFIIILLHDPFKNFLVNATNRYLFQKKYDPRKILKEFADEALTILNLDRLCKATVDTLVKHLYLINCVVLLLSREEIGYEIYDSYGIEDKDVYLDAEGALVKSLRSNHLPLMYQSYNKSLQAQDDVKKDMDKIQSQLCMPLVIHNELVGILSLGTKKSDQLYNAEDIDMLTTLTKALSIAISNARLFMQAAQNEKLAAIGTITSAINHEVCGPLNNISVNMQAFMLEVDRGIYKNQDELLKKVKDMIQDTREKIDKATNITSKLSSFAKPSKIVESKPIDIARGVEDALDLLRHKLELDRITIEKNIPTDLPRVLVDGDQMQQIFFNLIKNAAEAIKENGTITITAKGDNDRVKIEIKDTGCGISEDKLDEIFQSFYTTKGRTKGSGLGLVVVRGLIQRNNGNISVKSKVGAGTTFYLDFIKA